MPVPPTYTFSNPAKTHRLYYVQEHLVDNISGLTKPHQHILEAAKTMCAQRPPRALDLYRNAHQRLAARLASGELNNKNVIFVTGISKDATAEDNITGERPKSHGLDLFSSLMRSADALGLAWSSAYKRCQHDGFTPKLDREIIVAIAPVLIPISIEFVSGNFRFVPTFRSDLDEISAQREGQGLLGFGTLERTLLESDEKLAESGTIASAQFRESFYSSAVAERVFIDADKILLRNHTYTNRRITAAACEAIAKACRKSYLIAELAGYAGPRSGIFRHVSPKLYEVVGGRGGVLRNAVLPTQGVAETSAVNIIAGWLYNKWLGQRDDRA
ncbi:MAG: hypothetical protein HY438_01025 [DPANN group archaeon]|nr:hypothetical protein [DPANN group archaeon]